MGAPVTWYNGVPVTADKGSMHNPVHRIHELCRMGDFCAFTLDIDFPEVENALAQQLLENHGHLKEFFFEHHVGNVFFDAKILGPKRSHEFCREL